MIDEYLEMKIIVEEQELENCELICMNVNFLEGKCSHNLPPENTSCNVLVTRILNDAYVTLELIGQFREIKGDRFQIEFTEITNNTLNQINNIMLMAS